MTKTFVSRISHILHEARGLWLWVLTLHAVVALIPGRISWPDRD